MHMPRHQQTEEYVSRLVTSKMIYAKIDRPSGIVDFSKRKVSDLSASFLAVIPVL